MSSQIRTVLRIVESTPTREGAGVTVRRTIGGPQLLNLDPFLLLDELKSEEADDAIAGFPNHPHRGFETVSYVLGGAIEHRDNQGNSGYLSAGSAQWMTAGRGIVHSEMPQHSDTLLWGFQLWVNLPATDKMCAPRYQDIPAEQIPEIEQDDGTLVRIVTGHALGTDGPITEIATSPLFLDVRCPPGAEFVQPVPTNHTAFVYIYEGEVTLDTRGESDHRSFGRGTLAILTPGDDVRIKTSADKAGRCLLIAGCPLGEPIARYGPFVMNTKKEILEAIYDYQAGAF